MLDTSYRFDMDELSDFELTCISAMLALCESNSVGYKLPRARQFFGDLRTVIDHARAHRVPSPTEQPAATDTAAGSGNVVPIATPARKAILN